MIQPNDELKFVQRRVKITSLDVHPTEQAIVANYELEAALVGQLGDTMLEETKECQKVIRVRSLNETSDIDILAKEIVEKFDFIPSNRIEEIKLLLSYLKKRKSDQESANGSAMQLAKRDELQEVATLNNLDNYIELLYEDIPEKVKGSALALQLARSPPNLAFLSNNETFLGALARVLREDGKKSIDLSLNIVSIFFCFSVYSQFHSIVVQYKIGSLCMDGIEFELKRQEQWKEDLAKKKALTETEKDNLSAQKDYEKTLKKYQAIVRRQDQLLRVSFFLLLNLAEDAKVEMRMVSKGIVSLLVRTLDRDRLDLLTLVVTFLKKLSIFVENKNEMAKLNVVEKLIPLVSSENNELRNMTLRLLFNLSFDLELRNVMVKQGLLPKLVDLLSVEEDCKTVLCILNHISMDDRCKSMFTYTDCIPILMKMILDCPLEKVPLELVSLGVNLAANKRNAQLFCQDNGLKLLMKRVFRFKDSLLMKMIRNISQHDGPTKELFLEHVSSLGAALQQCSSSSEDSQENSEEFVLECIGVLGNLNIPHMNFEKLFRTYDGVASWLKARLDTSCEDDLLLEIIVLLGTAMADQGAASLLLDEGILTNIMDLLNAKQEDDEVVLQILYLFQQLLKHPTIRKKLIEESHIPAYLLDLMHDKNDEIRKVCDVTLDLIAEEDEEWAKKIQQEKFRWHNAHWLEVIENHKVPDETEALYGSEDIFDQMKLIYSLGDQDDLLTDEDEDSLGSPDSDSTKPSTASARPHSRYNNRSAALFTS